MDPTDKLKILILEDQMEDVYLINRELQKAGLEFILTVVDDKIEYLNSLNSQKPDIILSDHALPQFNSLEALQICKEKKLDIPFILVTGTVSEEFAAKCIKNGAADYVLKSNIKRLSTSILQALRHHEDDRKRRVAEDMIIDQNTELIKINSELDSFVYNISHNLRAPLLSLMGLINVAKLDTDVLNIKVLDDYLDKIDFCAKKLDKTLCEILDYSKNARGELILEKLDLKSIFQYEYMKNMYAEESNLIDYHIQIYQDNDFVLDKYRVSVIANNLISNAVKYHDKGKKVKKIQVNGTINEKFANLSISDNGIGIESSCLESIFKMFYRATTQSVGSGLGLYLVKESISKLGGMVSVSSKPNRGTTFYLTIPNKLSSLENINK
jgi:signal transduction histidine kinase